MALGPVGAASYSDSQIIRYRPDPGEPAVRLAAPANQSALLVTTQEQRNETRLRAQAVVSGDQILFSNRTFTPGLVGGDQAITAGLTTIVTREGANLPNPETAYAVQGGRSLTDKARDELEGQGDKEEQDETTPAENALAQTTDAGRQNEIEQDSDDIERELDDVESDRVEAEAKESEAAATGSLLEVQQSRAKQARLDLEEDRLEREKRQLELERFSRRIAEADEDLASVLDGSLAAAVSPLAALFGASDPGQQATRGQRLNLVA